MGASVRLDGTPYGAAADAAGAFRIAGAAPGDYRAVVSYAGSELQTHAVSILPGTEARLDVALVPNPREAGEAIVYYQAQLVCPHCGVYGRPIAPSPAEHASVMQVPGLMPGVVSMTPATAFRPLAGWE